MLYRKLWRVIDDIGRLADPELVRVGNSHRLSRWTQKLLRVDLNLRTFFLARTPQQEVFVPRRLSTSTPDVSFSPPYL